MFGFPAIVRVLVYLSARHLLDSQQSVEKRRIDSGVNCLQGLDSVLVVFAGGAVLSLLKRNRLLLL